MPKNISRHAARIAVMLGRQDAATAMAVDEVATDALRLARLALRAKQKIERQQRLGSEITQARDIATRYRATLIETTDPVAGFLGLQFQHGLFSLRYNSWLSLG